MSYYYCRTLELIQQRASTACMEARGGRQRLRGPEGRISGHRFQSELEMLCPFDPSEFCAFTRQSPEGTLSISLWVVTLTLQQAISVLVSFSPFTTL